MHAQGAVITGYLSPLPCSLMLGMLYPPGIFMLQFM